MTAIRRAFEMTVVGTCVLLVIAVSTRCVSLAIDSLQQVIVISLTYAFLLRVQRTRRTLLFYY